MQPTFSFFDKTGGNRPWATVINYHFSALGPELTPRRVAIWVVFYKNSTVSRPKTSIKSPL